MIKALLFVGVFLLFNLSGCPNLSSQTAPPTASPSPSDDELPGKYGWEPATACAHMADKLKPGVYRSEGNNTFGCLSAAKFFGAGTPQNNIVYFARGQSNWVLQIGLILNVNQPEGEKEALQLMHDYSDELSTKALGVPLSKHTADVLLAGRTGAGSVDTTKIQILRHEFPNGKGYELHYLITPRVNPQQ